MRISRFCLLAVVVLAAPQLAAQRLPPVRSLGPITKVSQSGALGSVSMVRPLPDGRVLVNDVSHRQLLLLDADFVKRATIADTMPANGNLYGARLCGLVPFHGDSTLFIDPASLSMVVIDARGSVARTMAVPSVDDVTLMIGGPFGTPGVDTRGRIVYRGYGKYGGGFPDSLQPAVLIDSAPVFRMQLATRQRETVGSVAVPMQRRSVIKDATGQVTGTVFHVTPLPVVDDWALMPDGRVAIVRGADYHVDWLDSDSHLTATAKIPFNWQRLDDGSKQRLLDSAKVEFDKDREKLREVLGRSAGNAKAIMEATASSAIGGGVTITFTRPDATSGRPGIEAKVPVVQLVDAKELPDYRPAFRLGAARADAEGNLWVRTTAPSDAGPIYDVINGSGELIDRVKLPFGRVISGFGPGVVYLGVLDEAGARLEMARLK